MLVKDVIVIEISAKKKREKTITQAITNAENGTEDTLGSEEDVCTRLLYCYPGNFSKLRNLVN